MGDQDFIEMLETIKRAFKTINQDAEVFVLGAQTMKNAYDALIEVGFTEDQAALIVANKGAGVKTS